MISNYRRKHGDSQFFSDCFYGGFFLLFLGWCGMTVFHSSVVSRRKKKANAQDGKISDKMRRVNVQPRSNWKKKVESDGFKFYDLPGLKWVTGQMCDPDYYWNEEGAI
jgi:hypothetical protein